MNYLGSFLTRHTGSRGVEHIVLRFESLIGRTLTSLRRRRGGRIEFGLRRRIGLCWEVFNFHGYLRKTVCTNTIYHYFCLLDVDLPPLFLNVLGSKIESLFHRLGLPTEREGSVFRGYRILVFTSGTGSPSIRRSGRLSIHFLAEEKFLGSRLPSHLAGRRLSIFRLNSAISASGTAAPWPLALSASVFDSLRRLFPSPVSVPVISR